MPCNTDKQQAPTWRSRPTATPPTRLAHHAILTPALASLNNAAGTYLAVKVDRYTKTKKSTYTSFELFSVKERDIPMEVLELTNKADKVVDFAWEPKVRER